MTLPNNAMLGIIFRRLRMEEGLDRSRIMSTLEPVVIYSILLNARFKQDKNLVLTNLEETLRKEAGKYIYSYVSEKWQDLKNDNHKGLPFPEFETKTLSDIVG